VRTIDWNGKAIQIIDQTALPGCVRVLTLDTIDALVDAIGRLAVRGAPALGAAGALGVALAAVSYDGDPDRVRVAAGVVRAARPTAVNLAWGVDRALGALEKGVDAVIAQQCRLGQTGAMTELIAAPNVIAAAGTPPKTISEFVGRVATGTTDISIAVMNSPEGWSEPGQQPEFDEYTVVIEGAIAVESQGGTFTVKAGQAVHTSAGEWVRYSTPAEGGARYVSVCVPAFSPGTVHRDE